MRKHFIGVAFVWLLLLATPLRASYMVISGGGGGMSCADADLLCESFEGALGPNNEYDLSGWTETLTGGTIDAGATHSGSLSCTDKGSDALDFNWTTPASTLEAKGDIGQNESIVYHSFYFYLTSESIPGGGTAYIYTCQNSSILFTFDIKIYDAGSNNYRIQGLWYDGTGTETITSPDSSPYIVLNTWIRIGAKFDNTNDIVELYLDGTKVAERTSEDAPTRDIRYCLFGRNTSLYAERFQVDNFKLDDDTMPGACP
jgi:hypothetical protein